MAALRARLAGRRGKEYWRSLEELAETADFQDLLRHEFPQGAEIWEATLSRRGFLKVMGASMAMAGLTGCALTSPDEKIVPYVNKPDALVPGIPLFFATAMPLGGYATGLLVRSNEGRPTKIEGNPDHPASLGATDVYAQASILSLYDPDRSQAVLKEGQPSTWEDFVAALNGVLATQRGKGGAGLRILTETVTSPTLIAQIQTLLQQFPQAEWYQYEPGSGDGARAGAQLAFGDPFHTIYNFDQANVVLSLDANFMLTAPGRVRYARQLMAGRLVRDGRKQMNRLYVVESTPSITGAQADHRLPLKASQVEAFARALAQALGINAAGAAAPAGIPADWLPGLVADLQANRGKSIVIAGEEQPAAVHALAHAINANLGNTGTTVTYTVPAEANSGDQMASLRELVGDMAGGAVEVLLTLDGNPAYSAPVDLDFAAALAKVGFRAHLGMHADETAALSTWHIPEAHYLESWGDARAFDGTVSIIQPLIAPIWGGKTAHDVVAALLGQATSGHDAVRAYWQGQRGASGDAFETFWRTALNKGVIDGTTFSAVPATEITLNSAAIAAPNAAPAEQGLELTFRLDPSIWDGRFANNGWLQELPKPLTTLTWDNVAMVSPKLAEQQSLQNGDVIELSYKGRKLSAPVWIMPGQPDESVAITLGYGRSKAGSVGDGAGFNAYALRTADAPGFGGGLAISKVGDGFILANTQKHYALEGRDLIRHATLEEFLQNPNFAHEGAESHGPQPSLYPDYPYNGSKWGMVIDTQACIGCNACVIACQSENNIAVVGKDQVSRSREMHWLKIDTYFEGDLANPATLFQPRLCMHCENAPCEVVCPVQATVHDHEGLNAMVYNRCVGTRYCSNNCPYKVRRYNFLQYSKNDIPVIQLSYNPEVTVRNRGVMEKCTYCVQRISAARVASDRDNRPIADGEVVTACQQACPTNAIVFGDLNIAGSQVAQLKAQELNYGLLEDLNTKPRTSYMPRVRNPNPAIKEVGDGV
ncbi:MAG: TAT-variant-translocated molybdopterin oxidoreductase [Roseiflexaceae bacterium]